MTLINVFKGKKTGETQMSLRDEGFPPAIVIPGEEELEFVETRDVTDEELLAMVKGKRET